MSRIKKYLKRFILTDSGKPRLLNWIFIMHTSEYLVRKWVAKNISHNDIVLDVGARKFQYTKYQNYKMLFGVDLPSDTDGYLGWTKDSIKKIICNRKIYPVFGNCERLPFKHGSFDVIFINEVIEHIKDDVQAISELSRVLKTNGKLLLKTPNGSIVTNANPFHYRHYFPDQLMNILLKYFETVVLVTKIPNNNLNVKQFLPKNNTQVKKAFYRYLYWIYYIVYGNWVKNRGSSIFVTCANPKMEEEVSEDSNVNKTVLQILACPKCKNELQINPSHLICNNCQQEYHYIYGIPNLIYKK